jgi:hypothetical protein
MIKDTIQEQGLRRFLDNTSHKHNNRGFDDFQRLLTVGDEFGEPVPASKIARAFGVSRPTIERWTLILKQESAKNDLR